MEGEMTEQEAIAMVESRWWNDKTAQEIAEFQLAEPRLCMPFDEFHKATEEALDRPVWTHEFAYPKQLLDELHGTEPKPEDPAQHALDSLAAMVLAGGRDPDKVIIPISVDKEP